MAAVPAQATFPGRNGDIAFTRVDIDTNWSIWTVDPNTRRQRHLTTPPRRCRGSELWVDLAPSYSPSGRRIVFEHYDNCGRGERSGVYVIRADGSGRKLLVPGRIAGGAGCRDAEDVAPVFSPRGAKIAFSRLCLDDAGPLGVVVPQIVYTASAMRQNGRRAVHRVPFSEGRRIGLIDKISWGPSRAIALEISGDIWVVRPNGSGRRQLTSGYAPDWSPDARWIAFHRKKQARRSANVYVARASGRGVRRLTSRGFNVNPVWSPDGRRIAFLDFDRRTLYTIARKSGDRRILARHVSQEDGLSWQPR